MRTAYPLKIDKETMAYASGVNMGISTKVAIEISNMLRGMALGKAKARLERIIAMKEAVPYRRFNKDVGHKPGIGPGRYPIKACGEVLKLLKSAEANALDKGLAEEALTLLHINANRAASQFRFGRQSRRKMKRTHLQIVLAEDESLKTAKAKKPKTDAKKPEAPKKEAVKDVKAEKKAEPAKEAVKTEEKKPVEKTEEKKPVKETKTEEKKPVEKTEEKKPVKEVKTEEKPVEKAEEKKPAKETKTEEKKPVEKAEEKKPVQDKPESKDIKESHKKEEKKAPKSQ